MSEAERSVPLSGPLSVTPLYASPGDQIVWWDGAGWNELGGLSAGPINVTGDVLGTGTSTVPTTVLALQHRAVSSTAPLDGQVLGWSASAAQWHPVPAAVVTGGGSPPGGATGSIQINAGSGNFGGITIGGDATLNYSTGALSLAPSGVTAGAYQGITFDAKGRATAAVNMNYAPLASPAFSGVPTAPTAPAGTNSIQIATTAYVDSLYSPGAYMESTGTSVTLTDGVAVNLASLSLAAGDWIIDGSAYFSTGAALNYNFMLGSSTTSATLPGIPYYTQLSPAGSVAGGSWTLNIPERKFTLAVPTTVYLVVRAGFGAGAVVTAQGQIAAQQMQKLVAGVGGGGPIALSGDVSTAGAIATVTGLQGRPIATTAPVDTQVLAWSSGAWRPANPATGGSGTPGGTGAQVQYNTGSGFGGSAGATFSATQLTSLAMGLGSDALGDIYFRNVTGHLQALPAGSPGFLLQMQGGVPTWQSVATGAGTVNPGAPPQIAQYTASQIVGGVTMSGDATIAAGGGLTLASVGTAGTYNNVTTDAKGRVIVGSNVAYLTANQTINLIGDNTGSGSSGNISTVTVGLQGRAVASTAPTATGDVLAWNVTNNRWQPTPAATGGGITSIIFASPLTGGTISTSGQTVGLTVPSANLLGGTGTSFTSVTVGTGLSLSAGTLSATASGGNVTAGTLTLNQLVLGGGAQAIGTLGTLGTGTTVLHGNAAGQPTWGVVNLAADVGTSQLPVANLGNGTGANNTTFWRGDGVWAAPSGSGSGTVVASLQFQMPYYATAGSVASVQGHPAITTTTGGSLSVNTAAGTHVAPALTTTQLQLVGEGVANPNLEITGFGGSPGLIAQRAGGTQTTPTVTAPSTAFVSLLNIQGRGYGTTGWTGPRVSMQYQTLESWNVDATHQGAGIIISTTPVATGAQVPCAEFRSGLFMSGTTGGAGGDMGTGTINATGYYVNGAPLGADTTTGGITAGAAQGNVVLASQFNIVTTVASGNGVTLPTSPAAGSHVLVRNSGANTLSVWPASGAQINTLGANTAISVLPNSTAYFEAASTILWFTVP